MTKRIINGKVYDTDTAKLICNHTDSNGTTYLYRKKTGEYFARRIFDPPWDCQSTILPLSWDDADKIAKAAGFGPLEESIEPKDAITINVDSDTYKALYKIASSTGQSLTSIINKAIKNYLKQP